MLRKGTGQILTPLHDKSIQQTSNRRGLPQCDKGIFEKFTITSYLMVRD